MSAMLMYTLYGNLIKELPYFRGLDEVVLVKLASTMKSISAMHGQPIMEEGKVGKEMYILVEGEVVVEKGGVELGYLSQAGSFFGENVVIDPRSSETRTRTVKGAPITGIAASIVSLTVVSTLRFCCCSCHGL
eukprot:COSAG05_NODE_1801_length_4060_cov_2.209291_2_plen_133_part_00